MNTELLLKVREVILKEPSQFNMADFFSKCSNQRNKPNNCGTAACIAGWAIAIFKQATPDAAWNLIRYHPKDVAENYLGISNDQAGRLFYSGFWPEKFAKLFTEAKTDQEAAEVAAQRIDYFIQTGK